MQWKLPAYLILSQISLHLHRAAGQPYSSMTSPCAQLFVHLWKHKRNSAIPNTLASSRRIVYVFILTSAHVSSSHCFRNSRPSNFVSIVHVDTPTRLHIALDRHELELVYCNAMKFDNGIVIIYRMYIAFKEGISK